MGSNALRMFGKLLADFSTLSNMRLACVSSISPAGVRIMPLALRTNSATPIACSSSSSRSLAAETAMASRSAARVSVPSA